MTNDHVFGSDQLTPELLRSATFQERDGAIDAAEVREFLDRVASSLEVFLAQDAPAALRAEFARNAEIAQQVLEAGQGAAEQLRRQAAEEAKRILDEARDATLGLRETVEDEIGQAREQVEAMRGTFIQDLRDLYDRIGASLYRFERAAEDAQVEPIREPSRASAPTAAAPAAATAESAPAPAPAPEPAPTASMPEPEPEPAADPATDSQPDADLPEGAKPPAWRQLPADAWSSGDDGASGDDPLAAEAVVESTPQPEPASDPQPPTAQPEPAPDPFAVVEDDPLAPGEPLVDLRGFADTVDATSTTSAAQSPAATAPDEPATSEQLQPEQAHAATSPELEAVSPAPVADAAPAGDSWLDGGDELPPVAPQADPAAAPDPDPGPAPTASPADAAGSWLKPPAAEPPADVAREDALAEALIAGDAPSPIPAPVLDDPEAVPGAHPAVAAPPPAGGANVDASRDSMELRATILELGSAGHSRDAIAGFLREQFKLAAPEPLIRAVLGDEGDAPG